ncbi:MAG: hypothetical protein P1V97_06780 [Planctomycetota bacterium]|nr:hypothetical protein [Planctomycetota bacterium]
MKKEVVAGAFVGIFCLGIFVGSFMGKGSQTNSNGAKNSKSASAENGSGQKTNLGKSGSGSNAGQSGVRTAGKNGAKTGPGQSSNGFQSDHPGQAVDRVTKPLIENPMNTPGNPDMGTLSEGDAVKRELEKTKGKGNGRVSTLMYDFDSPEAKAKWEEKRRKRWQTRLAHEIDVKIKTLKAKVGLTDTQASDLNGILQRENRERMRLVDLLTSKQISRTSFDEGVSTNVKTARQAVQGLLTGQQWAAYKELDPREQVLRDEVK